MREVKPRKGCKHCHGRGYIGLKRHTMVNATTGTYKVVKEKVMCRCIRRQVTGMKLGEYEVVA